MRHFLVVTLTTAAALAAAAPARAQTARHVPPAEATADAALELTCDVAQAWTRTLTVHWRPVGAGAWTDAPLQRVGDDASATAWRAVVPAAAVSPPGVEYYIDSRPEDDPTATPTPEFASAARPHRVVVMRTRLEERRERALARAEGRRYRVTSAAEYVDYGTRTLAGYGDRADRYYRIDLGFQYRLLAYPVERIQLGYTRLLGDVPDTERANPDDCGPTDDDPADDCTLHVGYKVGGWFGVRLGMGQGVDLDLRGMVMATNVGAGLGGAAELRLGDEDASHVAFGFEAIEDIGAAARFRLGWATVPRLPMSATIEVGNQPSIRRATGIRVLYDVAHPISPGVRLGARLGYAARDARIGGVSAGAHLTLDF